MCDDELVQEKNQSHCVDSNWRNSFDLTLASVAQDIMGVLQHAIRNYWICNDGYWY